MNTLPHSTPQAPAPQQGAALLMAMLTVALVATLAAAGMWLQWRSIEVEAAERQRAQSHWLLLGALDWARIILREDARAGGFAVAAARRSAEGGLSAQRQFENRNPPCSKGPRERHGMGGVIQKDDRYNLMAGHLVKHNLLTK